MSFVRFIFLTTVLSVFLGECVHYATSEFPEESTPVKGADGYEQTTENHLEENTATTTTDSTVKPETETVLSISSTGVPITAGNLSNDIGTRKGTKDFTGTSESLPNQPNTVTDSSPSELPVTASSIEELSTNSSWSTGYTANSPVTENYNTSYREETVTLSVPSSELKNNSIENHQNLPNVSSSQLEESKSLRPETTESIKVFVVHKKSISLVDVLKDQVITNIVKAIDSRLYSIDYIFDDSIIYFSDNNCIYRATFNGSVMIDDVEEIVSDGDDGPVMMAVDWIYKRLYWISYTHQAVLSADLDGSNVTLMFDKNTMTMNFIYPNNIVVDPYEGLVFFVNNYVIYKYSLDTSKLEKLEIDNIIPGKVEFGVRSITLDRVKKMVYLSGLESTSPVKYFLARIDYELSGEMEEFNITGLNDIYSMDILGDTLYFAHYTSDGYVETKSCPETLMSVNKTYDRASLQKLFQAQYCKMDIKTVKVFHKCVQDPGCNGTVVHT